jgi:hypothetical protein
MQVRSTNAIESYHSQLKKSVGNFHRYGLFGAVVTVQKTDDKREMHRRTELENFRTKTVSYAQKFPELKVFPFPVQRLIAQEIKEAHSIYENENEIEELDTTECSCQFYKKYYLPCKHMFYTDLIMEEVEMDLKKNHVVQRFLGTEDWMKFQRGWAECGYEIYFSKEAVLVTNPTLPEDRSLAIQNSYKVAAEDIQHQLYQILGRQKSGEKNHSEELNAICDGITLILRFNK